MPGIFRAIGDELNQRFNCKNAASGNESLGFQSNGAVVLRDRRGTLKAEIPNIYEKSETLGSDPLAIYKPSGAKTVDAAKAMGNFTAGRTRPSTPPKSPTSNSGSTRSRARTKRSKTITPC